MPRYPRLFLPDMPLHVVQRGHDRQPVFLQPADYEKYLSNLRETKRRYSVRVYAYCLMTNHVHLVLCPGAEANNISALMRVLAARQTRYVNKLENRTGTLWESRFKASLIDSDAYLLCCCRYVDLNPVRAAMVSSPEDYKWSSYRGRIGTTRDEILDSFPTFHSLGSTEHDRADSYRRFVARDIPDSELTLIRTALQRNQLTGNDRFRTEISRRTGRRLRHRGPGRPPGK